MKLYVVPDAESRCTVVIGVLGMVTPGLSFLIAGLAQLVMYPDQRNMRPQK